MIRIWKSYVLPLRITQSYIIPLSQFFKAALDWFTLIQDYQIQITYALNGTTYHTEGYQVCDSNMSESLQVYLFEETKNNTENNTNNLFHFDVVLAVRPSSSPQKINKQQIQILNVNQLKNKERSSSFVETPKVLGGGSDLILVSCSWVRVICFSA